VTVNKPNQKQRDGLTGICGTNSKKANSGNSKLTESQRRFAESRKRVNGLIFDKEMKALEEDDGYYSS